MRVIYEFLAKKVGEKLPRLNFFMILAVGMFCGVVWLAPHQAALLFYKLTAVVCALVLGYWADRALFPYARPDGYLKQKFTLNPFKDKKANYEIVTGYTQVFAMAMLRRAIIQVAFVIGVAIAL